MNCAATSDTTPMNWIIYVELLIIHATCRSDLRIATKRFDSRESEFPPTEDSFMPSG